jgi:tape measure domain-containing protein
LSTNVGSVYVDINANITPLLNSLRSLNNLGRNINITPTLNSNIGQLSNQLRNIGSIGTTSFLSLNTVINSVGTSAPHQLGIVLTQMGLLYSSFRGFGGLTSAIGRSWTNSNVFGAATKDLYTNLKFTRQSLNAAYALSNEKVIKIGAGFLFLNQNIGQSVNWLQKLRLGYAFLNNTNAPAFLDSFRRSREGSNLFSETSAGPTSKNMIVDEMTNAMAFLDGLQTRFINLRTVLSSIATTFVGILAAASLIAVITVAYQLLQITKDIVTEGIKYNMALEQTRTTFSVLLGDQQKAVDMMKQLNQYADFSTFTSAQVNDATQLLLGYGVAGQDVMHVIRMLGDTSMGNVQKFQSQALAFGQIFSKGRLSGDNLKQLTEAGFNPLKYLSKITGKDGGTLTDEMEAGKIAVKDLVAAWEMAVSESGIYYKMQEKQSQTSMGLWSTIIDKWSRVQGNLTLSIFESMKPILQDLVLILDLMQTSSINLGQIISDVLVPPLMEAFLQFGNLMGLTNSYDEAMGNLTNTVTTWVEMLAYGVQVLTWIGNVIALIVSIFVNGFLVVGIAGMAVFSLLRVIWTTLYTVISGIFVGIVAIVGIVVTAIAAAFQWGASQGIYYFSKFFNWYADYVNNLPEGSFLKPLNPYEKINIEEPTTLKDTWGATKTADIYSNAKDMFSGLGDGAIQSYKDEWKQFMDAQGTIIGALDFSTNMTNEAFKNLFTDNPGMQKFLEDLRKRPKTVLPEDKQKGIATQESTKGKDDEIKKIKDELKSATEAIYKFGDAFEKVMYEKFSPSKLLSRTRKFLKEFTKFTLNLNILEQRGVGAELVNNIRGMGQKGWGVAAGLARADDFRLNKVTDNLNANKILAEGNAQKSVLVEHKGVVNFTGTGYDGAYSFAIDLAKDIKNKGYNYIK